MTINVRAGAAVLAFFLLVGLPDPAARSRVSIGVEIAGDAGAGLVLRGSARIALSFADGLGGD